MYIYPAIDLIGGKAVRLYKGDYKKMTVYNNNPLEIAIDFKNSGAEKIHIVDLEGAKSGETPNFETILKIKQETNLFCEVGGGIRSVEVIEKYLSAGIDRVILGTAATDETFAKTVAQKYGEKIALGADIKDGFIAVKGWTEKSEYPVLDFCKKMQDFGFSTLICTDISKDGAMKGTNHDLYQMLSKELSMNIIASGGVSSLGDISKLRALNIHGAIVGKAYYTGAINLKEAIEVAK